MVEAAPSSSFEMSQPDLLLEFLIVAFDPPSQLSNVDELTERDVVRKRRQPIFDRLLLAIGPFNQQPLLRPTVGEPVIPMRDTNAHITLDAGVEIWGKRLAVLKEALPSTATKCEPGSYRYTLYLESLWRPVRQLFRILPPSR
jgi:hypothetical protein